MIVCDKCGHENADGRQFCEACDEYLIWRGTSISKTVVSLPPEISVTPGGDATAQLRVFNRGAIVDKFSFELPAELSNWVTVQPAALNLYPNTDAEAAIHFRPPRSPAVRAGQFPFTVTTRSNVNPDTTTEATTTVTVEPFVDLAGRLVPNTSRSAGTAEHQIKLGNGGNAPAEVSVSVTNPDDLLEFQLEPDKVTVQPGQGTSLKLLITPRDPEELAQGVPQPFRLTLTAPGTPQVNLDGSYTRVTRVELEGKLDPEASTSTGTAEHWVTLTNKGNATAAVAMSASDPGQLLTFLMTPSHLTIDAGSSARVRLEVGLRPRGGGNEDTGQSRGTPLPFQVLARAVDSAPVELNGTYTPLFVEVGATLEPRTSRAKSLGRHLLTAVNKGNRTATVSITAVDPEEALNITVTPPCLTIPPGQSARSEVRVGLRDRSSLGGKLAHPFELHLTSDGSSPLKVEGAFVLLFAQLTGALDPPTSKGIGTGDHWVIVENTGSCLVHAALTATDPRNEFAFELNPDRVSLEPGEKARVRLWLALHRRPRKTAQLRPFQVHITSQEAPPVTVEGTRAQEPSPRQPRRWPPILLRVLIAVALLLVGAVIAVNTTQMGRAVVVGDRIIHAPFVSLAAVAVGVLGFLTFVPRRNWFIAVGVLGACAVGLWVLSSNQMINI